MNPTVSDMQHRLAAGQGEPAGRRVERGEQTVLDEHARVGQLVEQGRLAGVGVADDGDRCEAALAATLALERPGVGQCVEIPFELVDPAHDASTIGLDLRLAATESGPHAAALLRQLRFGAAAQPRQPVPQEREFDLRLAFERVGVLTEDVEDHRRSIEGRAAEQLLQVELLTRRQLVVEHHRVGVDRQAQLVEFLGLALADVPGVVGRVASLHHPADLVRAGGVDEQGQFVEARIDVLVVITRSGDGDEHDPLTNRAVDEGGGQRLVVRRGHRGSDPSSVSSRDRARRRWLVR